MPDTAKIAHTPGPWVVDDPNSHLVAVLKDGVYHYVANCAPGNWSATVRDNDEIDANAALIAAAPDMLAALIQARARLVSLMLALDEKDAFDRIRAAIAKAEGAA